MSWPRFRPWRFPRLGVLSLILAAAGLAACGSPPRWNVLVVTFDTTRADRLSAYGDETVEMPAVDRLAAEGVRFAHAYSSLPVTLPSHSTIMTGKYPLAHGVRDNGLFVLGEEQVTLAEILREHGWATAAAIGGFPLVAKWGIDQGFDHFDDRLPSEAGEGRGRRGMARSRVFFDERRAARVNEAVLPWVEERAAEPFFLWVHYYDPHHPLDPPPPYDELYATDPYAGELAYADESFGNLVRHLEELGVYDRTLVVLTSDHGEGQGEHHESTHSYLIYNSVLHVPLLIRPPDGAGPMVVDERVGTVDIVPTVLDLLGLPIPDDLHGHSLAALVTGEAGSWRSPPQYAETLSPRLGHGWGELRAIFDGRWKYIHGPRPELFDVEADAQERDNLVAAEPERAAELRVELTRMMATYSRDASVATAALDEPTRRRLEALGYIASGSSEEAATIVEELRDGGVAPQDRVHLVSEVSQVRHLLFEGRALAARDIAAGLVAGDPESGFYLQLLAQAQTMLGQLDEALATIDRLLALEAGGGRVEGLLLSIGKSLYLQGEREEGLARIEQSAALAPSAEALYTRAVILADQGLMEETMAVLRQALEVDARHLPARRDLAAYLAQAGRREEAEGEFERLLREGPYDPRSHYNFGAFLAEGERYEEAVGAFQRAIELDARYPAPYFAAIAMDLRLEQREEAERLFEGLLQYAPRSPEVERARQLLEGGP